MKHAYSLFFILLLLLLPGVSQGQQQAEKLVSGTFSQLPFEQFARQLEAQTAARFYFDPTAVDSLFVTLQVQNQPLSAVLQQALQNTTFHVAFDDENRVFVTAGVALAAGLPGNFFRPATATSTADLARADSLAAATPVGRSRYVSAAEYQVYEFGNEGSPGSRATLAGHIRDQKSGEPVIGAAIYSESPNVGTSTDQFGYYSLTLPVGRYNLKVRGVGIKNTRRQVVLRADGKLEIEVEEDIIPLKEVVIEAEKDKNVSGMQMGLEKLDIKTMRQVPTAFGETDILRVVLTLPGVKSVGEGSTGLNVRGGATDQNLILFNDATVYNPYSGFSRPSTPTFCRALSCTKAPFRPSTAGGCRRCWTLRRARATRRSWVAPAASGRSPAASPWKGRW